MKALPRRQNPRPQPSLLWSWQICVVLRCSQGPSPREDGRGLCNEGANGHVPSALPEEVTESPGSEDLENLAASHTEPQTAPRCDTAQIHGQADSGGLQGMRVSTYVGKVVMVPCGSRRHSRTEWCHSCRTFGLPSVCGRPRTMGPQMLPCCRLCCRPC